jgi:hypothetical protein
MARFVIRLPLICLAFIFSLALLSSPHAIAQSPVGDGNQVGYPPFETFGGSNFDQVALENGNLHISIPIQSLPQRNGKTYSWSFVYDIPTWSITGQVNLNPPPIDYSSITPCGIDAGCNNFPNWRLVSNQSGWSVSYNNDTVTCNNVTYGIIDNIVVTDPDGAMHPVVMEFAGKAGATCALNITSGLTTDGAGILVTGSWPDQPNDYINFALTLKDGTQITPVIIGAAGGQQPTWEDNNGNEQTTTEDMLDRNPLTVYNAPNTGYTTPLGIQVTGPAYTTWTYTDSNGASRYFTLNYAAIDINSSNSFGCPGSCTSYVTNSLVPASLTVPNGGGTYTFGWQNDDVAELTSVGLPAGGSISYTYGAGPGTVIQAANKLKCAQLGTGAYCSFINLT